MTEYKSPTGIVWLLGRIYCTGTPEDYKAVHALQDQVIGGAAVSAYGKPYTPPPGKVDPAIDMKTAVREQVNALDARRLLQAARRADEDQSAGRGRCADGGEAREDRHRAGQDFDRGEARPGRREGLAGAPKPAQEKIMGWLQGGMRRRHDAENGWMFTTKTGLYGTDYLQRALVTAIGLGANRPQDAVYPTSEAGRRRQDVQRRKQVRHALREGPAAAGQRLLVADDVRRGLLLRRQPAQPLHAQRSATSSRPTRTVRSTCYIQNESPGKDKESNWLPAPKDEFILMLRLYWPKEKPPSILRRTRTRRTRSRRSTCARSRWC